MSFGRPYEQHERALIAINQQTRVPLAETAAQLGRGYAGVKSYASDNGLLRRPDPQWTGEQESTLYQLGARGATAAEIGAAVGRSASAVKHWLHSRGMTLAILRSS